MENNEYINKEYCKGCEDRIQPGKAYIKKDKKSAWYVVIYIKRENYKEIVYYRKAELMNISYESEVNSEMVFTLPLEDFYNRFKHVSTFFCPFEIEDERQLEKERDSCWLY